MTVRHVGIEGKGAIVLAERTLDAALPVQNPAELSASLVETAVERNGLLREDQGSVSRTSAF